MNSLDVPRPLAMLCTLFRLRPPNFGQRSDDLLFQALRIWTDVIDICESESFGVLHSSSISKIIALIGFFIDGHRKIIVEHTLNVLFFRGSTVKARFPGDPIPQRNR